jgi:hypothetical protein
LKARPKKGILHCNLSFVFRRANIYNFTFDQSNADGNLHDVSAIAGGTKVLFVNYLQQTFFCGVTSFRASDFFF